MHRTLDRLFLCHLLAALWCGGAILLEVAGVNIVASVQGQNQTLVEFAGLWLGVGILVAMVAVPVGFYYSVKVVWHWIARDLRDMRPLIPPAMLLPLAAAALLEEKLPPHTPDVTLILYVLVAMGFGMWWFGFGRKSFIATTSS